MSESALPPTPPWKRGELYERGDLVQWAGREWVALFATGGEPGETGWLQIPGGTVQ